MSEQRIDEEYNSTIADLDEDVKSEYGQQFLQKFKAIKRQTYFAASSNIDTVVDSIDSAVADEFPDNVYSPRGSKFFTVVYYVFLKLCTPVQDVIFRSLIYICGIRKPS